MLVRRPLAAVSTTNPGLPALLHTQHPAKPPEPNLYPLLQAGSPLIPWPWELSSSRPAHLDIGLCVCLTFGPGTFIIPFYRWRK